MRKILRAMRLVTEIFRRRQMVESSRGKGPYYGINADDGTTWSIYRRSGGSYSY